jgi:hypothetical protein
MKLSDVLWVISDWLFPRPRPLSKADSEKQQARQTEEAAECKRRVAALPDEESVLIGYLGECAKLLDAETARTQSVEGRLTSIMGLSSIAATIVFGTILAQATGTLHVQRLWLRWGLAMGALYLALQLCCAIMAALGGLSRQGYLSTRPFDIFPPSTGEARSTYLRRQINDNLTFYSDHQAINNKKVTQMAVAHCAIRNFLWFLLLLALVGAYGGVTSASRSDDLIEALRTSHDIQQLLRGPQGPQGPQGPKGEPCLSQPQPTPTRGHKRTP